MEFFDKLNFDWMGKRQGFIALSIIILIAGLISAIGRQLTPNGTEAFNLGVDFQGGTVVIAKFKNAPNPDEIRAALVAKGINDAVLQSSGRNNDEVIIRVPLLNEAEQTGQVDSGREKVKLALDTFGREVAADADLNSDADAAYKIIGTDSVGPVAGTELRNRAVAVTLLGLAGILLFIAYRYDWTYAIGAVIAVFHDVLITLAFFSIFQWEVSLLVITALLTLVGFSVNDSIVIFDRIRENSVEGQGKSLYQLTNQSINQTMSRTIITGGLVFLSVLALVLFGGDVLFGFSVALLIGVVTGTYSTIAIASPIALWWERFLSTYGADAPAPKPSELNESEKPVTTTRVVRRASVTRQKR